MEATTMNLTQPTTEARKFDNQKNRWDLMPFRALDSVARIMTYGAQKYGDRNWENGTNPAFVMRQLAAAYRHLHSHMTGNKFDVESGLMHLAHAATDILMALELELRLTERALDELNFKEIKRSDER
jgi:hypothetical protein